MGLWGIQPSEFWDMSPLEWWWLADVKRRQHQDAPLTHDDIAEAQQWAAELDAKIRKKR